MIIAVISFGIVAAGIAVSSLVLGFKSSQTSFAKEKHHAARALAHACAEDAITRLRGDISITAFSNTFSNGTCTVSILSSGESRTIQSTGTAAGSVSRVTVGLSAVVPNTSIASWRELPEF